MSPATDRAIPTHDRGHSLIFSEGTKTSGSSRNGSLPIYGKFKVPFPFFFWLNLVSCLFIFQNGTNYVCFTFPSRLPNFDIWGGGGGHKFLYWVLACSKKYGGCLNFFTFIYVIYCSNLAKLSYG